ncbi:MAG: OB-fold nucleic acid binding domain-containing protein, partial [Pseudomonadota bacterium]
MTTSIRRINDLSSSDIGHTVSLRGWVRTRRDSKAGLSFIQLHDGSCFDAFQVVANADLPNYADEVSRVTSGCSVVATGEIVQSQGMGQSIEMVASAVEVVGWVENPDTYPVQPK